MVVDVPAPSLARLGSSVDADLLYRCLLTFGPQTAGQLERDLGLSPPRVDDGLDELLSVGAVAARPRSGRRESLWVAMEPDALIPLLRESRHRRPGPRGASIRDLVPGAVPLGEGMRHLPSRALTRSRLAELIGAVRHEHLAMQPERVYDAESARSAVPMDRKLLTRGVRMRVLGVQSVDAGDPLTAYGRHVDDLRPDYREASEVPAKLIVMDRRAAFLPVTADNLDHGYLEITHEAVVSALVALFERQWAAAGSPQEQRMPRFSLTIRERTVVALLAQGHTDASAARAMHVSRRTVSTTLRDLMDRLGVDNRFQLGLAIGTLGIAPWPGVGGPWPPTAGTPPSGVEPPPTAGTPPPGVEPLPTVGTPSSGVERPPTAKALPPAGGAPMAGVERPRRAARRPSGAGSAPDANTKEER
jgi:DNA-binding CsgD family transcriptional regulator